MTFFLLRDGMRYFMGFFDHVEVGDFDEAYRYRTREDAVRDQLALHQMFTRDGSVPLFTIEKILSQEKRDA